MKHSNATRAFNYCDSLSVIILTRNDVHDAISSLKPK